MARRPSVADPEKHPRKPFLNPVAQGALLMFPFVISADAVDLSRNLRFCLPPGVTAAVADSAASKDVGVAILMVALILAVIVGRLQLPCVVAVLPAFIVPRHRVLSLPFLAARCLPGD